jgi:preprotein translocase subunit SecD
MLIRQIPFNTYLVLALMTVLVAGCQTAETARKKELSTLRLHLEVNSDGTDRNSPVPVYRANPVLINVEKTPFVDESNVTEAKLTDTLGGFAIQIQFDRRGTWLLEEYSTAHKGKRFAIYSQFGNTATEARWLAAPRIPQRIANGLLVFTPDATREEAERMVRGLNNVARKVQPKSEK